jgi:uncharacterized protein (TIGR03083 family)
MCALLAEVDEEDARLRVPACPGWTVADLIAHLAGLAVGYGSGRVPDGDRQSWREDLVAERRDRELVDLVTEWEVGGPALELAIAEQPRRLWPLVYDVIAHEHDLRGALARPGERDGEATRLGLSLGLQITADDLAHHDLPGITVIADGVALTAGGGPAELALESTTFEAFRLLGSRRTRAEMRAAAFTGDLERYLPGLVHMSLPLEPLGE